MANLLDPQPEYSLTLGNKQYELSNHLGNVQVTLSDKKLGQAPPESSSFTHYLADVRTAVDYYPFGMQMPRRSGVGEYRYGFNGMEKDDEAKGDGNQYTSLHRIYDPRLGRWLSTDPEVEEFPDETPYNNNQNNPIVNTDPNGDCPWCIGALVGAAVDAGLQLAEIGFSDDKSLSDFRWKSVAVSFASGAIGVGIASKIDKAVKVAGIASKAATTAIKVSTSAATDAATSAGGQLVKKGKIDGGEVLIDVIAGGTLGKAAGDAAEKVAKKSPTGKVLANQADRAKRVAANSTRPTRQEAAKTTAKKAENYAAKRGAAAGTAASGIASEAAKKLTGTGEDPKKN